MSSRAILTEKLKSDSQGKARIITALHHAIYNQEEEVVRLQNKTKRQAEEIVRLLKEAEEREKQLNLLRKNYMDVSEELGKYKTTIPLGDGVYATVAAHPAWNPAECFSFLVTAPSKDLKFRIINDGDVHLKLDNQFILAPGDTYWHCHYGEGSQVVPDNGKSRVLKKETNYSDIEKGTLIMGSKVELTGPYGQRAVINPHLE